MLIAASLVVAAFAAVSLVLAQRRMVRLKPWLGSAVLVAWVVGVMLKVHFDGSSDAPSASRTASLPSIAWPEPGSAVAVSAEPVAETRVASVQSLVGGLEQRLAKQPDDPKGWALLAQSYAFVGDSAGAEAAVEKAVALGFDEQSLRARVSSAARGAQ